MSDYNKRKKDVQEFKEGFSGMTAEELAEMEAKVKARKEALKEKFNKIKKMFQKKEKESE